MVSIDGITTATGDKGRSGLADGIRLPKEDLRFEAIGTVDELNSFIGRAFILCRDEESFADFATEMKNIQSRLFDVGSDLSFIKEESRHLIAPIDKGDITQLEELIGKHNESLAPLTSFTIPGACEIEAQLHICRTVARRAERILWKLSHEQEINSNITIYLNRLSDYFYVLTRLSCQRLGIPENLWCPKQKDS